MTRAPMILCCGDARIDMVPTPCTDGRQGFVPQAGGAAFNTAISLGRLNAPAGVLTGLSTDPFGTQLTAALQASGVNVDHAITADRPTTLAFVRRTGGRAGETVYDENSAGRMLTAAEMPALPAHVGALYFGGTCLAAKPGADAYAALAARESGSRAVMLAPDIRPGLIRDATAFRDRLDRMLHLADIVMLSERDLAWLFPGPGSDPRRMAALQALGPQVVIVTRGPEGAEALLPDGRRIAAPLPPMQVVDAAGAADGFAAGVLAHLSERGLLRKTALAAVGADPMRAALAFGATVAAATMARAGVDPPWRGDLPD